MNGKASNHTQKKPKNQKYYLSATFKLFVPQKPQNTIDKQGCRHKRCSDCYRNLSSWAFVQSCFWNFCEIRRKIKLKLKRLWWPTSFVVLIKKKTVRSPIRLVTIRVINQIGRPWKASPICQWLWLLTAWDEMISRCQLIVTTKISEESKIYLL